MLTECLSREPKVSAMPHFQGLISTVERKNSWQLAEQEGCENSYAFRHLLGRATCDVGRLRDSVCQHVVSFIHKEEGVCRLMKGDF